jgi:hypothetical protein
MLSLFNGDQLFSQMPGRRMSKVLGSPLHVKSFLHELSGHVIVSTVPSSQCVKSFEPSAKQTFPASSYYGAQIP